MNELIQSISGVNVIAEFTAEGKLIPMAVRWNDVKIYKIEKITYSNKCIGVMTSKAAQRYKVTIAGEERYLFYEANGQWFIENRRHILVDGC